MLLAEALKESNLSVQMNYMRMEIMRKISDPQTNGNPAFIYVGEIFPEVRAFLASEGFTAKKSCSPEAIAYAKGLPVYVVSPKENLTVDMVDSKSFQYGAPNDLYNCNGAHLPGEDGNLGERTFGQMEEGIEPEAECYM